MANIEDSRQLLKNMSDSELIDLLKEIRRSRRTIKQKPAAKVREKRAANNIIKSVDKMSNGDAEKLLLKLLEGL